jgi:hypothetical protein
VTLGQGVLLGVGAIVLVLLLPHPVRRDGPRAPTRRLAGLRRRRSKGAPPDLAALDRMVSMAVSSAEDEFVRLRPLVRDIASQRLADHTGVRLETAPDAAAALVGPEVWELLRPDRQRPTDQHARGIQPARLRAVVEALERIGAPV